MLPARQVILQVGLTGGCNPTGWAEELQAANLPVRHGGLRSIGS